MKAGRSTLLQRSAMTATGIDSIIRSSVLVLIVVTLVTGCSGITRPAPVRQTYLIEPAAPSEVAKPQPASLRVGAINVAAGVCLPSR